MKKYFLCVAMLAVASVGFAQSEGVGLGIATGMVLPHSSTEEYTFDDWSAGFAYGFYVNIPLIYTFHISPSAVLYSIGDDHAADLDLAFKFIVPLSRFNLYGGFMPGVTSAGDSTNAHVGALVGAGFTLISNLDVFLDVAYKIAFRGGTNYRILHAYLGVLFTF